MGTLSRRRLEDFGLDVKQRIEHFREHVGHRIEHITDDAEVTRGRLFQKLEQVPTTTWLTLAGAAIATSAVLKLMKMSHTSLFVGMLAPTFATLGLYKRV